MYDDNQPLEEDKLAGASLRVRAIITTSTGGSRPLPELVVPRKDQYRSRQDRPWWRWSDWQGQSPPSQWTKADRQKQSSQQFVHWMEDLAQDAEFRQFRTTGIHPFRVRNINILLINLFLFDSRGKFDHQG